MLLQQNLLHQQAWIRGNGAECLLGVGMFEAWTCMGGTVGSVRTRSSNATGIDANYSASVAEGDTMLCCLLFTP